MGAFPDRSPDHIPAIGVGWQISEDGCYAYTHMTDPEHWRTLLSEEGVSEEDAERRVEHASWHLRNMISIASDYRISYMTDAGLYRLTVPDTTAADLTAALGEAILRACDIIAGEE